MSKTLTFPQKFGNFTILEKIGYGKMSEVFKALAPDFCNQVVAIKRIKKAFSYDKDLINLLQSEATTLSELTHPNIVSIFDFSHSEDLPYIVMEYVDGLSLYGIFMELQKKGTLLPLSASCLIVKEVASALSSLHDAHLLHTDLAARNILLHRQGWVKLIDFSVAQAALNLKTKGTNQGWVALGNMSPEQVRGGEVGVSSDVFQLGLVLYKTIVGRSPFKGKTDSELYNSIKSFDIIQDPFLDALEEPIKKIFLKSLAHHPNDRYQSAQEFERSLTKYLNIYHPGYDSLDLARDLEGLIFSG